MKSTKDPSFLPKTCAPRISRTRYSSRTRCAMNGVPVAIIGQAFPYTPIANPRHFVPDWTFGIQESRLQKLHRRGAGEGREGGGPALAQRHGRGPQARRPRARAGRDPRRAHARRAAAAGARRQDAGHQRRLQREVPRRAGPAGAARRRQRSIATACCRCSRGCWRRTRRWRPTSPRCREPYDEKLGEKLATTEGLLYRRGSFNGSFDELILQRAAAVQGRRDRVLARLPLGHDAAAGRRDHARAPDGPDRDHLSADHAATSSPAPQIKAILEDVADNIFHADPYLRQGGDMVRVGGMTYALQPRASDRLEDLATCG